MWSWNLLNDLKAPLLHKALCIISNPSVNSNLSQSLEMLDSGKNWPIFCATWPWNLVDDLEKPGHLFYTTLRFVRHFKAIGISKLKLQSGNAQFWSKLIFCSTWPWKTIGYLFYIMSSFVYHFKSIGEVKLELQSGNAQFGSKLAIFVPRDPEIWWMTLKTIGHHSKLH